MWFFLLWLGFAVWVFFDAKKRCMKNPVLEAVAEQENPPKKLGTALLVVWIVISSVAVLVASGKDGGKGEESSGNTPKTSVSTSAAPEPLPALEARFIEIVSAAQGESRRAENDMQRGGIKVRRDIQWRWELI